MKFACPKCSTRYSIVDDKVPVGKIVKFPCKTCQHVIRLRRKDPAELAAPPPVALPEGLHDTTRVASYQEIDKLRTSSAEEPTVSASAPPLTGMSPFSEGLHESTKVASAAEMHALRSALTAPDAEAAAPPAELTEGVTVAGGAEIAAALARSVAPVEEPAVELARAAAAEGEVSEWYVLIAGKQLGPMPQSGVIALLGKREIDKRTFVWRSSMTSWERLGSLEAFSAAAASAGDAAWRVMKPAAVSPSPALADEETRAMDAGVLHEQLERSATPEGGGVRRFNKAQTVVSSDPRVQETMQELRDELARDAAHVTTDPFAAVTAREDSLIGQHDDLSSESTLSGGEISTDEAPLPEPVHSEPTDASVAPTRGPTLADAPPEDTLTKLQAGDLAALQSFDDAFSGSVESPAAAPATSDTGPSEPSPAYLHAPPGEATKVFMATAGIYKRRRQNRIAAIFGIACASALLTVVAMDVLGYIEIPGMGIVYDMTGVSDPNVSRALQRTETKLADSELDPKRRAELEALRRKLLGAVPDGKKQSKATRPDGREQPDEAPPTQGVVEGAQLDASQRDLAAAIMQDQRKQDSDVKLQDPGAIQTPNLPEGLTQDAIFKVIQDNNNSMKLCFAEAARKGEKLAGKMEVQLTIDASGTVSQAEINTAQFKGSAMGSCTVKRVQSWKFPRFNGEPVTVVFPYVLQMGL